ncbi:MAG: adenosylmethionine decarboxylase [Pirellulaceae bacterium]|nr:adenosylmethionine decarboxylase [Pirellulaceae bacterium]
MNEQEYLRAAGEVIQPASNSLDEASLGRHLLADLLGVRPDLLRDEPYLDGLLRTALQQAGFHILRLDSHKFPGAGAGVTSLALLSESHAAIHTYPEYEYLALDVFSCGAADPQVVLDQVVSALRPAEIRTRWATRGPESSRR